MELVSNACASRRSLAVDHNFDDRETKKVGADGSDLKTDHRIKVENVSLTLQR